jgi:hypothetical protein
MGAPYLDALLGRIFSRGTEVEARGGLNFSDGFAVVDNPSANRLDVKPSSSLVAQSSAVIYVTDTQYAGGAKGDGVTDDTAAIQAAIDAATAIGAAVLVPLGVYVVSESLTVPSGMTIKGSGGSTLRTVDGWDFDVIDIDDATDVLISDLTIDCAGTSTTGGNGIRVHGSSDRVIIERVRVLEPYIHTVVGRDGSIGTVTLRSCYCYRSGHWGYEFGNCAHAIMSSCDCDGSYLDSVKLFASCASFTATGGRWRDAGRDPANAGDGIDTYGGGQSVTLTGVVSEDHDGNGFVVKSSEENESDPDTYGFVRDVRIIGCTARRCSGAGFAIWRNSGPSGDDTDVPLPKNVQVVGCTSEQNVYGYWLRATHSVVSGCVAIANEEEGFTSSAESHDIRFTDCTALGNAHQNVGTGEGFLLGGDQISAVNCSGYGYFLENVRGIADYTTPPELWSVDADQAVGATETRHVRGAYTLSVTFEALWDGGDLTVDYVDLNGAAQSLTIADSAGATVTDDTPIAYVTGVTTELDGTNGLTATIKPRGMQDHAIWVPAASTNVMIINDAGAANLTSTYAEGGGATVTRLNGALLQMLGATMLEQSSGNVFLGASGADTIVRGDDLKFQAAGGTATNEFRIQPDEVGFFDKPPAARQTVSGSRGGNAALESLLTALENFGLITDSSS